MVAHILLLAIFAALSYLFSVLGIQALGETNTINTEMLILSAGMVPIAVVYYAIGALLGARDAHKGALTGYFVVVGTYVTGVLFDVVEKGASLIRVIAPMKYVDPIEIVDTKHASIPWIVWALVLSVVLLAIAFRLQSRKDL
jgi:uncharacterized membrane protein